MPDRSWATSGPILDPLLMTGVYWFVFTQVFHRNAPGEQPYIVFLILGLLGVAVVLVHGDRHHQGAGHRTASLVRSTNIPREIWVLKTVGLQGGGVPLLAARLALFMLLYGTPPSSYIVLYPFAIVLEAVLLTGIGLILSVVRRCWCATCSGSCGSCCACMF